MLKRLGTKSPNADGWPATHATAAFRPLTSTAALAAGFALTLIYAQAAPKPPRALDIAPSAHLSGLKATIAHAPTRVSGEENVDAVAGIVARRYRVSELATREFVHAAYQEAARAKLDPLLIVAVMAVESRFNPVAQSGSGAMGLMQVIPRFHAEKFDAAPHLSVLEPRANIKVGARILKEYIGRGGTELAGLQLYNGAASDAGSAYATRVLAEKQWLKDALRRAVDRARA
jgi:soluble lytic murein transglycosylase-like protein